MEKLQEIRIRFMPESKSGNTYELTGIWADSENKAQIVFECDARFVSLAKLIDLVEMTKRAGEDRLSVEREHGKRYS